MLYSVIMAGGSGTRLWPESRKERPKQFLRFKNDRPLILDAAESLYGLVDPSRVIVAVGKGMQPLLAEAVPWLRSENVLVEPVSRNTAPCIGLAAVYLLRNDRDAVMVVMPSDHIIEPRSVFCDTIRFAVDLVEESPERLVTLSVRPDFPSVSYGYIECGKKIESDASRKWNALTSARHVSRFHEKPDAQTSEMFLQSGRFRWNTGIFVWKARRILDMIDRYQPEMGRHLKNIADAVKNGDFPETLEREFQAIQGISIDYAVLEHAESMVTIEATFAWDDVGTWQSLDRVHAGKHDASGNLADRCRLIAVDASHNIVRCDDPDQWIALVGVENLIVVQTKQGTLIAHKGDEEKVRQVMEKMN
ncbi:MAG: sugar phosphate nucleotidyltransferase [Planctomycetaceae bacterium]|nr:sugar phosphate nucleotidyltransferase [Planctomycetaceae bacterium]